MSNMEERQQGEVLTEFANFVPIRYNFDYHHTCAQQDASSRGKLNARIDDFCG